MIDHTLHTARVLVVDDDEVSRSLIRRVLSAAKLEVDCAEDGPSALMCLADGEYDCCVVDILMPVMSGLDLLTRIADEHPGIPVLIVTGETSLGNAVEAIRRGAYDFLTKPIDVSLLPIAVDRALEKRRFVIERGTHEAQLENEIRDKTRELAIRNRQLATHARQLEDVTIGIISSMLMAMEAKDPYTAGHSIRVREYCVRAGRKMGLSSEELKVLERAAKLHDIGKLIVECASISKPGPLTEGEWDLVLKHPEVGDRMLQPFTALKRERTHIRHHHERFDGTGYPDGLSGNQIPLLTEIISVADSFDAMTSTRSYRQRAGMRQAVAELRRSTGTQFSERVVPVFVALVEDGQITHILSRRNPDAMRRTDVNTLSMSEPDAAMPYSAFAARVAKLDG